MHSHRGRNHPTVFACRHLFWGEKDVYLTYLVFDFCVCVCVALITEVKFMLGLMIETQQHFQDQQTTATKLCPF